MRILRHTALQAAQTWQRLLQTAARKSVPDRHSNFLSYTIFVSNFSLHVWFFIFDFSTTRKASHLVAKDTLYGWSFVRTFLHDWDKVSIFPKETKICSGAICFFPLYSRPSRSILHISLTASKAVQVKRLRETLILSTTYSGFTLFTKLFVVHPPAKY